MSYFKEQNTVILCMVEIWLKYNEPIHRLFHWVRNFLLINDFEKYVCRFCDVMAETMRLFCHDGFQNMFLWHIHLAQIWPQISAVLWSQAFMHSGHHIAKSGKTSKPRECIVWWPHCFYIWQASRQRRCFRGACPRSERLEKSKPESHCFETWRDCTVRRPSS